MSAAHHDDGHDAFDPEPVAELGADETPSPTWLPIVGAGLITAAIGFLFYPGADAVAKGPEAPPAAAAAAPAPAKADAKPAGKGTARARPAGTGDAPKLRDAKPGPKLKMPVKKQ